MSTNMKPALSKAWQRELPPGSLLNRDLSVVRPQEATTDRGHMLEQMPKPVSLASVCVTYGNHCRAQSDWHKGRSPRQCRNSSLALGQMRTASSPADYTNA